MVGALYSGTNGPGSSPGRGTALCSWATGATGQDTSLSQCLSAPRCINGYRRIYCWGLTLRWTSISSRGEQKYSQSLDATETGTSSGLKGHLARTQTLPFLPMGNLTFTRCPGVGKLTLAFRKLCQNPLGLSAPPPSTPIYRCIMNFDPDPPPAAKAIVVPIIHFAQHKPRWRKDVELACNL